MYRLLIIDDEYHIVDWLVELFTFQQNMNLETYHCYNGYDGLSMMKTKKIDILLLDIKMPGISGLEVAEKAKENWPDCQIIFLTGHSNFDYIYRAEKLNPVSYLLKTESDETILHHVKKAILILDEKKTHAHQLQDIHNKEKSLQSMVERTILKSLVIGKSVDDLQDMLQLYQHEFQFSFETPIYILYAKTASMRSLRYIQECFDYEYQLSNLASEVFKNRFLCSCINLDQSTYLWFLQPISSNEGIGHTFLKEYYDDFVNSCKEVLHLDAIYLLYDKSVTFSTLRFALDQLEQYTFTFPIHQRFHSYGILFSDKESQMIQKQNETILRNTDTKKLLNELQASLFQSEKECFFDGLNRLQFQCRHISSMHFLPMIEVYQSLSLMFTSYICQYQLSEKLAIRIGLYRLYYLNDFRNWSEAFDYLRQLADNLFMVINSDQLDHTQKLLLSISNYISSHIEEPVTLSDISNYLNYNSSYISRLFKQKMDMNISDYIASLKIEKAKELILSTNQTVEQIAKLVGYENSKYFFQVFKKHTGVSPKEYKK